MGHHGGLSRGPAIPEPEGVSGIAPRRSAPATAQQSDPHFRPRFSNSASFFEPPLDGSGCQSPRLELTSGYGEWGSLSTGLGSGLPLAGEGWRNRMT